MTTRLRAALICLGLATVLAAALTGLFVADRLAVEDGRRDLARQGIASVNLHFIACRQMWLAAVVSLAVATILLRGVRRLAMGLGTVAVISIGLSLWITPAHFYIGTAAGSALQDPSAFVWGATAAGVGVLSSAATGLVSWRSTSAD